MPTSLSAFFTSCILILLMAIYSYFSVFWSHAAGVKTKAAVTPAFQEPQAEEQVVNIPYFVESEELQSTLTLNNNRTEATTVAVTIFNTKGMPLALSPITLPATTAARFKLEELLKHAPDNF